MSKALKPMPDFFDDYENTFAVVHACAKEVKRIYDGGFWRRLKLRFGSGLATIGVCYSTIRNGCCTAYVAIPNKRNSHADNVIVEFDYSWYRKDFTVLVRGHYSVCKFDLRDPNLFEKILRCVESLYPCPCAKAS